MSVHDVIDAGPALGHLSMSSGFSGRARMVAGVTAHSVYQGHRAHEDPEFDQEVSMSHRLMVGDWEVVISGRMDGLSREGGHLVVEEIKTSAFGHDRLSTLGLADMPNAVLQLQMYMHALQDRGETVIGRLVLISVRDGTQHLLHVPPDPTFGACLLKRLGWILDKREAQLAWFARRRSVSVPFAHPTRRPFQLELSEQVEEVVGTGGPLLLSAPTGIGKTAGVLHGVLVAAYHSNRRVYFATVRTTQQRMVEDTVRRISAEGLPIKALSIRARDKACLNTVVSCRPDCCRFAAGHHDKVRSSGVEGSLWAETDGVIRVPDPDTVSEESLAAEVCPFALSMSLCRDADVVIGDYNYAFDPSRRIGPMANDPGDWIVIVDEAHNLPERARGYASPELKRGDIVQALDILDVLPPFGACAELLGELLEWVDEALSILPRKAEMGLRLDDGISAADVAGFSGRFEALGMDYSWLKAEYSPFEEADLFSDIGRILSRMRSTLDRAGDETVFIYRAQGSRNPPGIMLLCRDPAPVLRPIFDELFATVIMSATLKPMDFYASVLGLSEERAFLAEYESPFPPENRRVLVVADVSTEYRKREKYASAIAAHVEATIRAVPGNVAVFFSSFALRDSIAGLMGLTGRPMIFQERNMDEADRARVLDTLALGENHVLMGVLGGIFAEGIDLPGAGLLAAVIVGPALPAVGLERKLMAAWYQETYENGFRYAYQVPGMARVVQAAGRVIRGPEDVGAIVLIGQRFVRNDYCAFFPDDWNPQRCTDVEVALDRMWPSDGVRP